MNDDRDLQQYYLSERSVSEPSNNKQTPEFEAMWTRATAEKSTVPTRRPALPALMALAAIVIAVTAAVFFQDVFINTPDNQDALASFVLDLENEQILAFSEWETPTDFLLSENDDWFYSP